jgi:tetratricopeptide (TPR) repeat protein
MRQLDLFADHPTTPVAPTPSPEPEPPAPLDLPDVLPGQVGLFEPRSLLLGRARAAVARGQLDEACRELDTLRARCPDDAAVAREALEIGTLRERLARIDGPRVRQRARALVALASELARAPEPRASLRRHLLARAGAEIRRQHGDTGELDGRLAGEYLLEAGDLEGAQASFAAAFAADHLARPLFLLADATWLLGDVATARRLYLQALILDPFDPALPRVRDDDVRSLPQTVRLEVEIDDEAEAWSAPAGILLGVLPRPALEEAPVVPPPLEAPPPRRQEALVRARAFVEALVAIGAARGEAVIELRRTMKRLSPQLFELYMDRMVRSRPL